MSTKSTIAALSQLIQTGEAGASFLAAISGGQVLPSMSDGQIQWLLEELRKDGRVELRGQRRWARWHLSESKPVGRM